MNVEVKPCDGFLRSGSDGSSPPIRPMMRKSRILYLVPVWDTRAGLFYPLGKAAEGVGSTDAGDFQRSLG